MNEPRLKILPPWSITIKKLAALFDGDPQIAFNVDWSAPSVVISCNNGDKVAALLQLLPSEITYGNVKLPIVIDGTPSNIAFKTKVELFNTAFKGNPAYAYAIAPGDEVWWLSTTYVVFKNCVVQFFADNLNDCHGLISCLYQDLAQELLTGPGTEGGVFFNTDVERANLGMPLGEWP
jgi:hypothetical protein